MFIVQASGWEKRVDFETTISFGWKKWRYDSRYNDIKQNEASPSSFSANLLWHFISPGVSVIKQYRGKLPW